MPPDKSKYEDSPLYNFLVHTLTICFEPNEQRLLQNFKDPFMLKERVGDGSCHLFNFPSPTIGPWTQRKHSGDSWNKYDMLFDEYLQNKPIFWDHTFPRAEFVCSSTIQASTDHNLRMSYFEEEGTDVGSKQRKSTMADFGRPTAKSKVDRTST